MINFDEVFRGYVVLNANSKVAKFTKAYTQLGIEDVEAYAQMAEELYRFPIMYVEYSGTYGDVDKVKAIANMLPTYSIILWRWYKQTLTKLTKCLTLRIPLLSAILYITTLKSIKTVKIKESNK